ncbi:MAG: hypothetical protein ACK5M1_06550 [Xanthomarina gelatinilytica]|uniref:hypothetical protein n=1 Tax=Xanthomarina gelatinilytica TaxID=1137281 RepID=UPI003A868C7C
MTIRERKRILYFLEAYMANLESHEENHINIELLNLFSRKELMAMVLWLHTNYDNGMLSIKTDSELLELLDDDANVLAYIIEQWRANMSAVPKLTQDEVDRFFQRTQNEIHYLASKPVEEWDSYDVSNYRSLLLKTGTTKKVFGIFTSDVLAEDVYAVTTKPSYFFDTKEEAEAEIENIVSEGQFSKEELVVHKLWLLQ